MPAHTLHFKMPERLLAVLVLVVALIGWGTPTANAALSGDGGSMSGHMHHGDGLGGPPDGNIGTMECCDMEGGTCASPVGALSDASMPLPPFGGQVVRGAGDPLEPKAPHVELRPPRL